MRSNTYLMVFFLSACASNKATTVSEGVTGKEGKQVQVAQAEKKSKKPTLICTREKVVGTHFSRRICRTPQQMEIDRLEMEDDLDTLRR